MREFIETHILYPWFKLLTKEIKLYEQQAYFRFIYYMVMIEAN